MVQCHPNLRFNRAERNTEMRGDGRMAHALDPAETEGGRPARRQLGQRLCQTAEIGTCLGIPVRSRCVIRHRKMGGNVLCGEQACPTCLGSPVIDRQVRRDLEQECAFVLQRGIVQGDMGHPKKRLVREIGGFVNTHLPTEKPQKCLAMGAIKYA